MNDVNPELPLTEKDPAKKWTHFGFLPGLAFFSLHVGYSYVLFHINSYKLLLLGLGVSILWGVSFFIKKNNVAHCSAFKLLGLLILPVLVTLPAMAYYEMHYNYYFPIEFASKIFLILWSYYLFAYMFRRDSPDAFIFWVALTVLYVSLYAILEKFGLNPLEGGFLSGTIGRRVNSTFGNVNYFAGFLITVLPLLICPFLGTIITNRSKAIADNDRERGSSRLSVIFKSIGYGVKQNKLIASATVAGVAALFFTETRAALMASLLSFIACFLVFVTIHLKPKHRRVLYGVMAVGFIVSAGALFFGIAYYDELSQYVGKGNRYVELLNAKAWYNRLGAWTVAWKSIADSPFFGHGLGSSYTLFFEFVSSELNLLSNEKSFNHVHNEHLEFIQEAGFIGYAVLIGVVGFFLAKSLKLLLNKTLNLNVRMLALACITGIAAFYFHGVFSVAQRMIVANTGLYSLFAVAFFLNVKYGKHSKKQPRFFKRTFSFFRRPARLYGFVFLPLLAMAWFVFYGWSKPIIDKNLFSMRPAKRLPEFLRYADEARQNPSVYILHTLMSRELKLKRYREASKTGRVILNSIPHFRNVEYLVALAEFYQGNDEEALLYLNLHDRRNKYGTNKNFLQAYLALKKNDRTSFEVALKNIYVIALFQKFYPIDDYRNIDLKITDVSPGGNSSALFTVDVRHGGVPVDYKNTNAVCNVTPATLDSVTVGINGTLYDTMYNVVKSRKRVASEKIGDLNSYFQKILANKIQNYRLQICPSLPVEEKEGIATAALTIEKNKNRLRALLSKKGVLASLTKKDHSSSKKSVALRKALNTQISDLQLENDRLKNKIKGKSNADLYEAEIRLVHLLSNTVRNILRYKF